MGLIKEPKNVDFYVIDKVWADNEQKELSAFIKMRKEQRAKLALKAKAAKNKQNALPSG